MRRVKIPQIKIQTTKAELGLTIRQPKQQIQQPQADMQIQQPAAELSIHSTVGQLYIDSSQARRDIGMVSSIEMTRNYAEKGKQAALAGVARRAREGEQLMSIENGGNAIYSIIDAKTGPQNKKMGIKFIPSGDSVKTTYTPATVDIQVQKNEPKINVQINNPIHNYTPGNVIIDLIQKSSIQIDWEV